MTLAEITAQFVGLMNRGDLRSNTALQTTFLTQATLRIQRELRVTWMEETLLETIDGTYDAAVGLAIPEDHLELIGLYVGSDQEYQLQRSQTGKVKSAAVNGSGTPRIFARLGDNWIIGPPPVLDDVILVQYYRDFTDPTALYLKAWDAVVYGALAAACDYYNDDRGANFEKRYNQILQNLQNMSDADELTADAAVGPVYAWPDDGID